MREYQTIEKAIQLSERIKPSTEMPVISAKKLRANLIKLLVKESDFQSYLYAKSGKRDYQAIADVTQVLYHSDEERELKISLI